MNTTHFFFFAFFGLRVTCHEAQLKWNNSTLWIKLSEATLNGTEWGHFAKLGYADRNDQGVCHVTDEITFPIDTYCNIYLSADNILSAETIKNQSTINTNFFFFFQSTYLILEVCVLKLFCSLPLELFSRNQALQENKNVSQWL